MRKSKMRKYLIGLVSMAMVMSLAACGNSIMSSTADNAMTAEGAWVDKNTNGIAADSAGWAEDDSYGYAADEEGSGSPMEQISESGVDNSSYYNNRKLIKTVNMEVETKEFDHMLALLEAQVAGLGGYIEDMYTYNGSRFASRSSVRNASMTARIPKEQLSVFLDTIASIGNVISRSENIQDVTLSYVDTESRKDALRVEQERLLELLKQAENMDDILNIEDRLTMVRYQLESAESQLRTYDNKVDFATVYLNLSEVEELTPVEEETTWQRIANGFADSLKNVGDGLVDFFVWFVVSIPYLIIWAIVIVVILLIARACSIHSKKRRAMKQAQMPQTFVQSRPMQPMPVPGMQPQAPIVQPQPEQAPQVPVMQPQPEQAPQVPIVQPQPEQAPQAPIEQPQPEQMPEAPVEAVWPEAVTAEADMTEVSETVAAEPETEAEAAVEPETVTAEPEATEE